MEDLKDLQNQLKNNSSDSDNDPLEVIAGSENGSDQDASILPSDNDSSHSEESFASDRNDILSLQQIKLETGNDGDDDQINLRSARRSDVLSPSNESHRGTGDSPRRSQSKKKSLLAIGAMFVFIGSIGTAVIWKNQ